MCTPQCIFEKLGGLSFDEAFKTGKYVVRYAKNLKNLQDEMRDLDNRREDIESKVCEASDRGEDIKVEVKYWQTKVDELKEDVDRLMGQSTARENMRCITCSCPNIRWRYKLSKQAEENMVKANKLTKTRFEEISRPKPRPPEFESLSDNNYVNFDSRASILKYLTDALKDSNVNMIGVYGLGGVGKTTLVKEVGDQMRQDGTFKQVAIAAVSKDLNVKEVQSKLAESVNLKLKATTDDQEGRRTELWNKFKNGDKYLVILDDIWEMVDLKKIGIPISDGKTGCKVVLTSRKEDLLRITMKADRNFPIAELPEAEAWDLFKKKVGNSTESQLAIYPLAYELCKYCKGLPLTINALGTALQDKPVYAWKNALDKLKRSMLTQIEGIDPSVIATLRVSYDMLRSSEAQSCFLLCCLYAKDAEIPVDELTRCCMATHLFAQNPRTFDEARNLVCTMVDILKSASLLTKGSHENVVKVPDAIRDVGIAIAREEKAFLIDYGVLQWPSNRTNSQSYSAISLCFKRIKMLPEGLVYPQLPTLMVDNSELSDLDILDNFFNGMAQLTVLTFARMRMQRLPSSLAKLTKLRMLYLNGCELEDIAILRDLKSNLEVLSLRGSSIKVIPQGLISNLISLEELYFPDTFKEWEATTDEKEETNNNNNNIVSLEELRWFLSTGQLATLHIYIPDAMLLPNKSLMFGNLKRFRISVGSNFKINETFRRRKVLKHEGYSSSNVLIPLVNDAEVLYLSCIKDLKNVLNNGGVRNVYLDMEYLLYEPKSFLERHELHLLQSFNNLIVLRITECKSKYLFSLSTSRELVHLEELILQSCEVMEEIVGFEGQNDEDELTSGVKFGKLKRLVLQLLPNLLRFYAKKEKMGKTAGSSSVRAQPLFNEKVIFPVLEVFEVDGLDKIVEIWDKQSSLFTENTVSFRKLREMKVQHCKKLMNLFPSNILPRLQNLQKLCVEGCPIIESVVYKNEKEQEAAGDNSLVIPQLTYLTISDMENLESFYSSSTASNAQSLFNYQVIFPVLEVFEVDGLDKIVEIWDKQSSLFTENTVSFCKLREMKVQHCKKLMNLFPSNILPRLQNLQKLCVEGCPIIESVVYKNEKEQEAAGDNSLVIPHLTYLTISDMENLESFYSSSTTSNAQSLFNYQVIFPVLEVFEVDGLDKIVEIWDKQSSLFIENTVSFRKLREMKVQHCKKLMNLFPSNILPRLQNLQKLCVEGCPIIESVVYKNEKEQEAAGDNSLVIPQLTYLTISDMENLESFYSSSTASIAQSLFNYQVTFPRLENLELEELQNVGDIWGNDFPISSLSELKCLKVEHCANLGYIFRPSIPRVLVNLQELIINDCSKMEAVVDGEEEAEDRQRRNANETLFPHFTKLELRRLPKLRTVCHFTHPLKLPLLSHMVIEICPRMNSFSLGSVSTPNLFARFVSYDFVGDDTTVNEEEETSKMG